MCDSEGLGEGGGDLQVNQVSTVYNSSLHSNSTAPQYNTVPGYTKHRLVSGVWCLVSGVHNLISFMGITKCMSVSLSGRQEWRIREAGSISDSRIRLQ